MERVGFKEIRTRLSKTQKEMAWILGVSIKAVHSYEQGWRNIPHHVERQILFLLSRSDLNPQKKVLNCWDILKCPGEIIETCPAWEFQSGDICWFVTGMMRRGSPCRSWEEKIQLCRQCIVFKRIFDTMG
ncbi:MAG: helix-turn-helix transcriptional regulator [Thermodesulfobacteriota bacterium]|nr:helix-turn-helix transcriptional regulator [Thermodesulfobacteriota bacterium]